MVARLQQDGPTPHFAEVQFLLRCPRGDPCIPAVYSSDNEDAIGQPESRTGEKARRSGTPWHAQRATGSSVLVVAVANGRAGVGVDRPGAVGVSLDRVPFENAVAVGVDVDAGLPSVPDPATLDRGIAFLLDLDPRQADSRRCRRFRTCRTRAGRP